MYRRSYARRPMRRFGRAGFRRSGSRLTTVHRPVRWERGNFYFEFLHLHEIDGDRVINTVVPVAMMNNLITSGADTSGIEQSEIWRALEIGGIKFTCVQNLIALPALNVIQEPENFSGSSSMMADSKILLVSDSTITDPADGLSLPQAVLSDFWQNTMPMTRTKEIRDVQSLFPRRIHWQNFKQHNAGFTTAYADVAGGDTTEFRPFHPQDQQVSNSHSGANLRLRLRLSDDDVLSFFLTSFVNRSETLASFGAEVQFKVTGTIWYRFRS